MKTRLLLVGLCLFLGFSSFSQNAYYDALTLRVYKDSLEKIYPNSSRGGAKRTFFGYLDTKRVMNAKDYEAIKSFAKKPFSKVNNELNTINQLPNAFKLFHEFDGAQSVINDKARVTAKAIDTLMSKLKLCIDSLNTRYKVNVVYKTTSFVGAERLPISSRNLYVKFEPMPDSIRQKYQESIQITQFKVGEIASDLDSTLSEMAGARIAIMDSVINKNLIKKKEKEILETQSFVTTDALNNTRKPQLQNVSSSGSGLSLDMTTRMVDATARWLVKRTKQELTLAFFDKLRNRLDTIPELRAFFPATYLMLQNDENIYRLPSLGNTWLAAFHTDVTKIPQNFESYIQQYHPEMLKEDSFKIFLMTYHSFDLLEKGTNPATLLDFLKTRYATDADIRTSEVSRTIRLLALLSDNLIDLTNDPANKMWIRPSEALKQFSDPLVGRYFLGLLYQKDTLLFNNLKVGVDGQSLGNWLGESNNRLEYFNQTVSQFLLMLDDIQKQIIYNSTSDNLPLRDVKPFLHYTQSIFDMVNVGFQIKYLLKSGEPDTSFYKSAYNQKWKPIATDAIEAIKAFYTKSYGSGLLHTIAAMKPIWTEVSPKDVRLGLLNNGLAILQKTHIAQVERDLLANKGLIATKEKEANQLLKQLKDNMDKDSLRILTIKKLQETKIQLELLQKQVEDLTSQKKTFESIQKSLSEVKNIDELMAQNNTKVQEKQKERLKAKFDQITFYANFMTDVITSDSTTDLQEIIDKYAAPVGSYSLKRKNAFSLDINAYPGLYAGVEQPIASSRGVSQSAFVTGITAPIGVAFSWGKKRKVLGGYERDSRGGHSLSLFVPIVDIGAAFSYRWSQGDEINGFPKIKFSQIFAPGCYLVWGVKNAPIALKVGAQITPQLREVNVATSSGGLTNTVSEVSMLRYGMTLSVDIPVFHLFEKRMR